MAANKMLTQTIAIGFGIALFSCLLSCGAESHLRKGVARTALDDYVERPDPHYTWELIESYPDNNGQGYSSYLINFTSQMWKDESVTSHPLWYHYLIVVVPTQLRYTDSAFLVIDNGDFTDPVPTPERDRRFNSTAEFALLMGAMAADLKMIPNQAVSCQGDPAGRTRREDDLIAWTWRRYVDDAANPADPDILLRLPMVKATVRALDTLQEFARERLQPSLSIDSFMIEGGSKRGWTAYLTAAVDTRVFAFVPQVITCLNFTSVMLHQYRAYNGWSFSNKDYYNEDLMVEITGQRVKEMMDIIDPYVYFDRLTMPKFLMNGAGDEHFMPDDSWYFWNDFIGPKYIWMIESSGHNIGGSPQGNKIKPNIAAFFKTLKEPETYSMPQLSWTRESTATGGAITVRTDREPLEIKAVYADTTDSIRRDFRMHIGMPNPDQPVPSNIEWFITDNVDVIEEGVYRSEFNFATIGWRCFFIRMTFEGPDGLPLVLSTEVNIIPDILPYAPCEGASCRGVLL